MTRVVAVAWALLLAGPAAAGSPGSRGAEVLKFGAGPRAFAMGGAQTALVDDVFSLNLNPAGLASVEYREAAFVQNNWVEGITQQSLLYAHPDPRWGTFSAGLTRLSVGSFEGYDASGQRVGEVKANDLVLSAGYGTTLADWDCGIAARWLEEKLDTAKASTFAVDIGARAHATEVDGTRVRYGAVAQNLGPGLKFDRETARLPTVYKAGVSATRTVYGDPVSLTLDVGLPADEKGAVYGLGAEAGVAGVLTLRAGYRSSIDLGSGLSFGMGLKAKSMRLDYAFLLLGEFGATHRFGLTFRWGEPIEQSRDRDLLMKAKWHKARGRELMADKRYLEAMQEFQKAIDIDPLDKEALSGMRIAYEALPKGN